MSPTARYRQHLTSTDMSMILRVHGKVCAKNAIASGSLDAERVAVLLVREFQHGVNTEANLMAAFMADGDLRLSVPVSAMRRFIGNAPPL